MLRPMRTKLGILRPLRLKMGTLRLCSTKEILSDFARPKEDMLRLCTTQIRYVATFCDPNKVCCDQCDSNRVYCDFVRLKYLRDFVRPPKICCHHCGSKWEGCSFVQPKNLRDFARPKAEVLRLPGSRCAVLGF